MPNYNISAPSHVDSEIADFIRSVEEGEFFVNLPRYSNYHNKFLDLEFYTLCELVSIAECYQLNLKKLKQSKFIFNTIDLHLFYRLIENYIENCGCDKMAADARYIIEELEFYKAVNETSPKNSNSQKSITGHAHNPSLKIINVGPSQWLDDHLKPYDNDDPKPRGHKFI